MAYIDDEITTIKDDIERLRTKPHMYISHTGKKGALHLCREVVNNAIDESVNPLSPCDKIEMILDMRANLFTVSDNGRGIPFDKLVDVCTYLQSGSNLYKETGDKKSKTRKAGEHGVGLTAVNALSDELSFIIYRNGEKGIFKFIDGKLNINKIEKISTDKHGTVVSFVPSEKYLKKCNIDEKDLRNWIEEISYLLNSNIKSFNLKIISKKGEETSYKLARKRGIADMLNIMVTNPLMKPIRIESEFNDGDFIDVVFNFDVDDTSDFTNYRSFCNWVNTVDGGEHVKAVKYAWGLVTSKLVNESLSEKERKNIQITYDDCRQGLCAVINLTCLLPYFTGQTKQQVGNEELYKPLVKIITSKLTSYFRNNTSEAKKIVNFIKKSASARIEVKKLRKTEGKKLDSFDTLSINGYWAPKITHDPRSELFLTEGDSAANAVTAVRDKRYQGVMKFRGNPMNVYGLNFPQILENEEVHRFFKVGQAGIGPTFDSKKFAFGKVIFFVDSDIDGWNMVSLFSAMMLWCCPQLVKEGRVYRTLAPLYIIEDPKHPYILSKAKYYELFSDKIVENFSLEDIHGHKLNESEVRNLISKNNSYLNEINSLQKYFYVNSEIFEFIIANLGSKNLINLIRDKFHEVRYNERTKMLEVIYKDNHYSLIINENFFDKCKRLINLIKDVNNNEIYFKVKDKGISIPGIFSLGSIFKMTSKYLPVITERIKGLGELPGDIIWETVLNPKSRELIRLTCSDLEMELEKVKILHGKDPSLRRKFMEGYVLNPDDLDT